MEQPFEQTKGGSMARIISVVLAVVFGLMLVADLARADGAATYAAKCKMCHGADGKGNAAMGVPAYNLTADLAKAVTEGKPPKMPSYKGKLTDAEIGEVVEYIKTLK